jgi:hypothetical protein
MDPIAEPKRNCPTGVAMTVLSATAALVAAAPAEPSFAEQKLWAILWLLVLVLAAYGPYLIGKTLASSRIRSLQKRIQGIADQEKKLQLERKKQSWERIQDQPYLGFLMGADGRLSTSKTVAAVWTLVVAYILTALIIVWPSDWQRALSNLSGPYLALLGGPFAAAVLAKILVTRRVGNQTLQKTQGDGIPRLSDLVSDDSGTSDLFDMQYILFNALAVAFVLTGFAKATLGGFPEVPTPLWLLTGGPAAIYVSNKAFGTNTPLIFSVNPARVRETYQFTVYGQNFAPADSGALQVQINGASATIDEGSATDTSVRATVPPGAGPPGTPLPVAVITRAGLQAYRDEALTIIANPVLRPFDPPVTVAPGQQFTLHGSWTVETGPTGLTVLVDGAIAPVSAATRHAATATVPPALPGGNRTVSVTVTDDVGTSNPQTITIA